MILVRHAEELPTTTFIVYEIRRRELRIVLQGFRKQVATEITERAEEKIAVVRFGMRVRHGSILFESL